MLDKHIQRHANTDCTSDGGRTYRCPICVTYVAFNAGAMGDHLRAHQATADLAAVGAAAVASSAVDTLDDSPSSASSLAAAAAAARNRRASLQQLQSNKYACDRCSYK